MTWKQCRSGKIIEVNEVYENSTKIYLGGHCGFVAGLLFSFHISSYR